MVRYNGSTFSQLKQVSVETNGTDDFLEYLDLIYTSTSEILDLVLPSLSLTYKDEFSNNSKKVLFIIESNGSSDNVISIYKGGNVTKLIEGNDVAPVFTSETIYIATNNGIHIYKDNKTEKYGTLNDKFISIALLNNTNLYALSEDRKLYKIVNNGTKKVIVNEVNDAERIVSDIGDNIYYYNSCKHVFVYNNEGVRKVEGMPNNITNIVLIKATDYIEEMSIIINNDTFCYINCNESCTAKCSSPYTAPKINAAGVADEGNYFVAVGNAVYEYDFYKSLYALFASNDTGLKKP